MLDPRTHQPTNPFQLHDETTRHRNRAHYSTNYYSTTWEPTNNSSGFWPSKTGTKSKQEQEDDESGMCSPPLWSTSPSRDHDGATRISSNHYRSLSPASRTQAIVRGQRELMDMVRNMPETNYELSLKDLVEHHRVQQNNNTAVEERISKGGSGRRVVMGQVKRSGSVDRGSGGGGGGGFYLKMAFPSFSLGSIKDKKKSSKKNNKDKKKNESLANSKVSPRPSVSDGSGKGGGVDKEWWKKSPLGSRESTDSGVSSVNSGSTKSSGSSSSNSNRSNSTSNNRRHRHEKSGGRCWPCIPRPKRQTKK